MFGKKKKDEFFNVDVPRQEIGIVDEIWFGCDVANDSVALVIDVKFASSEARLTIGAMEAIAIIKRHSISDISNLKDQPIVVEIDQSSQCRFVSLF